MEYFVTLAGDTPKNLLLDGVDASWNRIPGGEGIAQQIDQLIAKAKVDEIHSLIPDMIVLKKRIEALPASTLRNRKVKQINDWVIKAAGIHLNATTNTGIIAQGDSVKIKTEFIARAPIQIKNLHISLAEKDSLLAASIQSYKKYGFTRSIVANQAISQPYWFKKTKAIGHFEVDDQQKIGQSFVDPAILVKAEFSIDGSLFSMEKSVE
jgi:excinuclease UvrABC ATPase subunit